MQTSTGKTSEGLQENLSYFQFSKRGRTLAVSSSTDSEPSPGEIISPQSLRTSQRQRPRLTVRPRSSGDADRQRIRIQLIEENSSARSILSDDRNSTGSSHARGFTVDQLHDDFIGRKSTEWKHNRGGSLLVPSEPLNLPTEVQSSKQRKPRQSWTRTRSGGVWYLRQRDTSSHDGSSTRSVKSDIACIDNGQSTSINIVPMKPPARPRPLQISPTNHIVVETPFGEPQDAQFPFTIGVAMKNAEQRRSSAIDVKRIFSAPLTLLRRSRWDKSKGPSPSPAQTLSSASPINVTSHNALARSDETGTNLKKVSSMLESHLRPTIVGRLRSCSRLTGSSTASSEPEESRQSRTKALIGAFRIPRNTSIDHVAEHASSIFNRRMGSTPQNSPSEKATYKIKRRPSAATEEFIKIDISVRGATSYLPSEARRISTPPLPGDRQSGGRRGFFFDYSAPHLDEVCQSGYLSPQFSHVEGQNHASHHLSGRFDIVRSTSAKLRRSPNQKAPTKMTVGDWYETQLADLDAMNGESDMVMPAEINRSHQCKHECQARLAEIMQQRYEAQLDHSIPEHLPNSPLCPRNPRYWRVKQQKGSQFRGCWMHGFGEYDVVPGLHK